MFQGPFFYVLYYVLLFVCVAVPTTGGNAGGQPCLFPFLYNDIYYNYCTTGGPSLTPWCATTANFDVDGLWANCISMY